MREIEKNFKDVILEVGKLYEYTCKWQRPLMQKPRGRYISSFSNSLINPGETFILLEKMPKTISYIKICVINTGKIGWFYTGFTNKNPNGYLKGDSLSKILKKLI